MAYQNNDTEFSAILEAVLDKGMAGLPEAVTHIMNQAMLVERERHLQASPYERTDNRISYANGYKNKQLKTRLGKLDLLVPQTRDSEFYPSILTRGMRSESALRIAVAEMYFNGVSTRKVKDVMRELCGFEVTSTEVSRCAQLLDDELEKWRNRKLGQYSYVYLDALYEKVRYDGVVQDCAVLVAVGVNKQGQRDILGLSVALSEQELHWRGFLESLQQRGLHGMELIISDAHSGLKAARRAVFPSVPWQRCQFHLQQNAQAYITRKSQRKEVAAIIRAIFNAANKDDAIRLLNEAVSHYEKSNSRLANWMEENITEGLTCFDFNESHRRKIRTSNVLERLNKEIRRRTRIVGVFANTDAVNRLTSAVLMEIADSWLTGRKYLVM